MRHIPTILTCILLAAAPIRASDDAAPPALEPSDGPVAGDEKPAEPARWYDRIAIEGDLRLRYEGFDWPGHYDDGRRDRFRYRLRFGLRGQLLDNFAVGFELRSGNPKNPISDNQSLDGSFAKKPVSIGEAYVDWQALEPLEIVVGKFSPTNLWSAADMEWDDDVVTEGAMELLSWSPGGAVKALDLNLYQFVLNESSSSADSYLLGGQVVPVFALGDANQLAVGAGFEAVTNPKAVANLYLEDELEIDAGYVTNLIDPNTGDMVSDFRVGTLFLEWKSSSLPGWPVKASVYLYKNFGAGDGLGAMLSADGGPPLTLGRGTDNDTAWFGRVQVGDYKKPGQVAVRLSRYDSRPDALFFAYGQSDTRRSSNVDAYRVDLRIGMPKKSYVNVTYYRTNWTIGEDAAMNRWQFDYVIDF